MTKKRYLLKYSEFETSNGKIIEVDPYFIDTKEEYVDEDDFTIDGYLTMSDEQVLNLLNENEQLKEENKHLRCIIESNSQDDYIDFLEKQNEMLKERIEELASNDKIIFMVNE